MMVCLDTNVLVQARATGHVFFPILNAWVAGKFGLAVSTPILLEYEEVIAQMTTFSRIVRSPQVRTLS